MRHRGDVGKLVQSLALDTALRASPGRSNSPTNLRENEVNKIEKCPEKKKKSYKVPDVKARSPLNVLIYLKFLISFDFFGNTWNLNDAFILFGVWSKSYAKSAHRYI